jgi:four helix bundle protein
VKNMLFKDLLVWQRSARLSAELYKATAALKDYGFRDQLTRSGLSVPSNIAEGYGRGSGKELVQFLRYAKGSAAELETQIYIGMEIGYLEREQGKQWAQEASELQAMLGGLIKARQAQV